jgi:hypothetical protein
MDCLGPEALFSGSADFFQEGIVSYIYYSFVTLTTLGYGDISPITPEVKTLSILEAVVGQLYLAVILARLVGLHIAHSANGKQ